jgi:hypothetical protein
MTATPTVTEAEAIGRGWYAYRRVVRAEWPAGRGEDISEAVKGVALALETYRDLLAETTHPGAVYPELEHEDDAYDKALSMTAQDAADWAAELDRLVPVETERAEAA